MIDLHVEIEGVLKLQAWLLSAPAQFDAELYAGTIEGTHVTANAIAAETPVRTGALRASEQTIVEKTAFGSRGKIFTDIRYARYVERGTREHGRAQWPFKRGAQLTRRGVEENYDRHVGNVVDRLR